MKQIEKFLEALEEQGLCEGQVSYKGKKYIVPKGRKLKNLYIYGSMLAIVIAVVFIFGHYILTNTVREQGSQDAKTTVEKADENNTPPVEDKQQQEAEKKKTQYREWFALANNYLKEKNLSAALEATEKAQEINNSQEIRDLIKDITMKKDENDYQVLFASAQNKFNVGQLDDALADARKAQIIKNTHAIKDLINKINDKINEKKHNQNLENKIQFQLNAKNFQAALEILEQAKGTMSTEKGSQMRKLIGSEEEKCFNENYNLIDKAYQQGDFEKAREYYQVALQMKLIDKAKEDELKKFDNKINPQTIIVNAPGLSSSLHITFDPIKPGKDPYEKISNRISFASIGTNSVLLEIIDEINKELKFKGLEVIPVPAEYFKSTEYEPFWETKYDSGKWQYCTRRSSFFPILLQRWGYNSERIDEKNGSNENLNQFKYQIFVRFIIQKGGNDE